MSALNTIYSHTPYTSTRDEQIPHTNFFDVLYQQLTEKIGEERTLHEIPYIFAYVTGRPLVEVNFTDQDIQEKWESFRDNVKGLDYSDRLEIFEVSGLNELIGTMPPFYTFAEHQSYWQQHPDIHVDLTFNNEYINLAKLLDAFPIAQDLKEITHQHNLDRKKGQDNFNSHSMREDKGFDLESVYTVISLANGAATFKELMQSEYDSPSGKKFPPSEENEAFHLTNRDAVINKWLEQGNDLMVVYHHYGKDLSHFSELAGVYGYNTHYDGILEIVGDLTDKGRNGIPTIMLEKAKAIAKADNLLITVPQNMNTGLEEYIQSGGKIFSKDEAQSHIMETLKQTLKETTGSSGNAKDIVEWLETELYGLARQTRLGIQYQEWQLARQNGIDAKDFGKNITQNINTKIHMLMRDLGVKDVFESSTLTNKVQHVMDFCERETWHEDMVRSEEFQRIITDVWQKLDNCKPKQSISLPTSKLEQEKPNVLKP